MKKRYGIFILLLVFQLCCVTVGFSQSCAQVEIKYKEPDCYKEKGGSNGSSGDPNACKHVSACEMQSYQYQSSLSGVGYTYLWTATGPASISFSPNAISDNVNIVWPVQGTYTLSLTVTDGAGNSSSACLVVSVKDKPTANFSINSNNVCAGSTVSFNNMSTFSGGSMQYSWSFGDGSYSNVQNPSHVYSAPGTYQVCLIASSFITQIVDGGPQGQGRPEQQIITCCADTLCQNITIKPGNLVLDCISTVCAGTTQTYSINCQNTTWGPVIGGSIINSTGNQITIQWGNGALQGQISAACTNSCTSIFTIPIIPATPVPVGNLVPCLSDLSNYTLPVLPGTFYSWSLINSNTGTNHTAALYTSPDNNSVWINWASIAPNGTDDYVLGIVLDNQHICCTSQGSILIKPRDKFFGFFDQTICLNDASALSVAPTAGSFNWSVSPTGGVSPTTGTGASFAPVFSVAGSYTATVTETASTYCNSNVSQSFNITVLPATPPPATITGPANVCVGSAAVYNMASAAPTGYHYTWTITAGTGTLSANTGNSNTITWTVLPGTISVVLERDNFPLCPSTVTTFVVNAVSVVGNVSGNTNVCVDGTATYTITGGNLPPGEPVTWSISPANQGTITAGQGTSSVTILWHGGLGAGPWGPAQVLGTTACGGAVTLGGIMIYPKFTFSISQTNDICTSPNGATLTASAVANSPTYLWSTGATVNPINVTNAGGYSCTITNAGGCTFTKNIIVEDPFQLSSTCVVGTCVGSNMQHILSVGIAKPASGTFTYQWFTGTYPSGSPILGTLVTNTSLSNSYTATSPGNYYVVVNYGICSKYLQFNVPLVCCPDINNPQITSAVQNNCFQYTFTGTVAGTANGPIIWNFGDGQSASGASGVPIQHTYTEAGIYCVSFCVGAPTPNPSGCVGNCALTTVVVPIKARYTYKLGCNGCVYPTNISADYSSSPATVSYNWILNGNSVSSAANPATICGLLLGTNTLTLVQTYNNNLSGPANITCQSTATETINFTPLSINVSPLPVCTGNPVSFSSNPAGFITYSWAFGDNTFAYTPTTTHIYNNTSPSNTISLAVTDELGNVCTAAVTGAINTGSSCTISPGYICPGGQASLSAPLGSAYAWEEFIAGIWQPANGTNTLQNYNTNVPGQYRVKVTNANGCVCISNAVAVIHVPNPDPKINVSPSRKLCAPGGSVYLDNINAAAGETSNWHAGSIAPGNLISGSPAATVFVPSVSSTTTYILVVTSQYGCTASCSATVEVNPNPAVFNINATPTPLCEGTPTTLTSTALPAAQVSWSTGQTGHSIVVTAAGTYIATVTNPTTGCFSTKSVTINKKPSVALYPHYCDDILCTCHNPGNPFAIYAPRPLIGPFVNPINIAWYSGMPPGGTLISSGITNSGLDYTNLPTGVPSGTYYITMTDIFTGCSNTSEPYTVNVENCIDCDCSRSAFSNLTYTVSNPTTVHTLTCGSSNQLTCNNLVTINGSYLCNPLDCHSEIKIIITPPAGPTITGSLPFTFNPNLVGNWTILLQGYCDGKLCQSCEVITFIVTCPPLQVNLLDFKAIQKDKSIAINWSTSAEYNNDYFILDKASDATAFSKLATIDSKSNNSVEKLTYNYVDKQPVPGINYYQLKAVDTFGKMTNSQIIALNYQDENSARLYPNAVNSDLVFVEMYLAADSKVSLDMYDMMGRQVLKQGYLGKKGTNKWPLDVSKLAPGKYQAKITTQQSPSMLKVLSFEKL